MGQGTFLRLDRITLMPRLTRVSVVQRRALNQALIHAAYVPARAYLSAPDLVRALRSALRMSQAQMARRCGLPRQHIAKIESGEVALRLDTLARLLKAMFCELVLLPRPLKRPGDALAERDLLKPYSRSPWSDS